MVPGADNYESAHRPVLPGEICVRDSDDECNWFGLLADFPPERRPYVYGLVAFGVDREKIYTRLTDVQLDWVRSVISPAKNSSEMDSDPIGSGSAAVVAVVVVAVLAVVVTFGG